MARRQRRTKTNKLVWYALYAVVGYYGYNWFKQYQLRQAISTPAVAPQGTGT